MKTKTLLAHGLLTVLLAAPMAVNAAIYVNPISATASSADMNRPATKTTDGSGLSDASLVDTGALITNAPPGHGTDSGAMWRTGPGVNWSGATVTYELGSPYDLTGMHVWNYNEVWTGDPYDETLRGVKDVQIEYQAGTTNWVIYTSSMELDQATGNSSYAGTNYNFSSTLAGVTAVRFTCITNWAENISDRIGLSEVRFIAEEPQLPLAPFAKKLWINGTTAKLYWNVGAGATSYQIKRSETSGTNYVTVANVAATNSAMEYWNTNLVSGTTYYYVIVGENVYGEGLPSTELSGTVTNFSIISDGNTTTPHGTWNDSIYTMAEAVFDGDTTTAYDANISGGWAGIDLGEGNDRSCPAIDFHPRVGNESRMNGAQFQGSSDGVFWDPLATVSGIPTAGWHRIYSTNNATTSYRYFRCYNAQFGNVAEVKFLTTSEVDDVYYAMSPEDGEIDVAVDAGITVTFTDVLVDFNSLIGSYEMLVNSNVVAASKSSATGVTTFTYNNTLAYETAYTVHLSVYRTDGVTNTVDFSFTTVPDYFSGDYLIAPGIRNGGFELVNGVLSNTTTVTDFTQIDNWVELVDSSVSTRYSTSSPEGARYLNTQRGMQVVNMTDHVIQEGESFDFKWVMADRPAGVIVGLCYSNGVEGVTNVVDSNVIVADATWIYGEWSGSYVFTNGSPAIGSTLGLMIQENPMTPGETTITEAHVDKVRLLHTPGPSVAPLIHLIGAGGGTVSLMWDSESGVTYHILSTSALPGGPWTTNDTVYGDGSTIMTDVSMGGFSAEFFRLEAR